MNILFVLKSLDVGGVEQVTVTLANQFTSEGHNVVIWSFFKESVSIASRLNQKVTVVYGAGLNTSKENIASLRKTLADNQIQILINQWGLPYVTSHVVKRASKGLKVRKLTVYHNDPSTNGRLKDVEIKLEKTKNQLLRGLYHLQFQLYKAITSASMRYAYRQCDKYILLSPSFINGFRRFTGILYPDKLKVLTNPVTIDSSVFYIDAPKEKEVIYVGRLDYNQKRVYRIIETWTLLEKSFPDWRLTIVGDGEERAHLEAMVQEMGLQHVRFEGFKNPLAYYQRASILLLFSAYEGFPLVLAECMSFGVVPVVYNSYSAVEDIVEDGVDGNIVPFNAHGFDKLKAAEIVGRLMGDDAQRRAMSLKAVEKSRAYSMTSIYEKWMSLFNSLQ